MLLGQQHLLLQLLWHALYLLLAPSREVPPRECAPSSTQRLSVQAMIARLCCQKLSPWGIPLLLLLLWFCGGGVFAAPTEHSCQQLGCLLR
jgi:hypothetical protein